MAAELAQVGGVSKLLVAEDAALDGLLPERVTPVLLAAQKQFNFSHIIGERPTLGYMLSNMRFFTRHALNPGQVLILKTKFDVMLRTFVQTFSVFSPNRNRFLGKCQICSRETQKQKPKKKICLYQSVCVFV